MAVRQRRLGTFQPRAIALGDFFDRLAAPASRRQPIY
jgi:hypothetical protein